MSEHHDAPAEPDRDTELFIDFANTLHGPGGDSVDDLADASGLGAWLAAHGLTPTAAPSGLERSLPAFHVLRTLVRDTTSRLVEDRRPSAAQVRRLNRVLRDGLHYHQLQANGDGTRFTVGQVGDELDQARAAIAGSLAHFVAEHDVDRLRICAADDCRWRFTDRSPAGRRRWCDMRTCGNRAKVARHRARQRLEGAEDASDLPERPAPV
jgi:predicted RNA-binding Zn ribbon-like protein